MEAQEPTEDEIKERFLEDPQFCPFCGHTEYTYRQFSSDNDELIDECTCSKCDKFWYAHFTLSDCSLE